MSLTDIEQTAYAFYVAGDAQQFTLTDRYFPHGELVMVLADKVQVATRKFGRPVSSKATPVATALLDALIANGAFSTKKNDFGGSMHQFQDAAYKAFIKAEQDGNPIIQEARNAGPDFWAEKFASLTGQ